MTDRTATPGAGAVSPSGIVTRFAPSPTGFLHIGGARTALFNWLYARHHGGRYLLRIEDTDRARSTEDAKAAILDGLAWLGLDHDGPVVYQSENLDRHAAAARRLLEEGKAYHCYASPQELAEMRETAKREGRPMRYDGRWRDRDASEAPEGVAPVVRFKAPREGETIIEDLVQGTVRFGNEQLDDMVLLRADGTPTYMLSVVVDDHDMGITHIIRGDDHLTNAARQYHLFKALGWEPPRFAHIPLIHGPDGAKLSKRHGALGVDAYRDMGYLPEALCNYLLRLGWSHGDDEIISTAEAIDWFDLDAVGRGAARFDFKKLDSLNGHYIREADDSRLTGLVAPLLAAEAGRPLTAAETARLQAAMPGLKARARRLPDITEGAMFLIGTRPLKIDDAAMQTLDDAARNMLGDVLSRLKATSWETESLETALREFTEEKGIKFGALAQPLRAALTGRKTSPGIFDVLMVLGRDESLGRIQDQTPGQAKT